MEDHGENEQTKAYAIKYAFKEQCSFLPSMSKADGPETSGLHEWEKNPPSNCEQVSKR